MTMDLANGLVVDEAIGGDNTSVALHPRAMKRLQLLSGDTISIEGKKWTGCNIPCIAVADDTCDEQQIRMNKVVMSYLRVTLGDVVSVHPCPESDVKSGKRVHDLPVDDTIEGVTENLNDDYLKPYFTEAQRYAKKKQMAQARFLVQLSLRHPEFSKAIGVKPPKGILLYGPPGSGKALVARAAAKEAGASFFCINGREIMSMAVKESESHLRKVFEEAKKNAPSVIFIDEVDSIARKNDKILGDWRIVAELMTLMDRLKSEARVIVIGATSRLYNVNPSLKAFGRFEIAINIDMPDEAGRLEILRNLTKNMKLSDDVDLEKISKRTSGYARADLAALCTMAEAQFRIKRFDLIKKYPCADLSHMVVSNEHFSSALAISKPYAEYETVAEVPNVNWGYIGGHEDVKIKLQEEIKLKKNLDKYSKFGMSPSKGGVLLYGPSGCGKTLLGKAVANELQANFIRVDSSKLLTMAFSKSEANVVSAPCVQFSNEPGSKCQVKFINLKEREYLTKWFGESAANILEIFDKACRSAPCVLFFDELDSIAALRGSSQGGVADRVLNQFLSEIDRMPAKKKVFIIGATSRPDIIDPAVFRHDRLDQLMYVPLPDEESRYQIFDSALGKYPVTTDMDLHVLAKHTEGFSGADIKEICNRACKYAIHENIKKDIEGEKRRRENPKAMEGDVEDEVAEIEVVHFEKSMKFARKSVSDADVLKCQVFEEKLQQSRVFGSGFCFGETSGAGKAAAAAADEDDLYTR